MALMTAIENVLILTRTLVLSRLLEPLEFGLMAMAFIATNAIEVLSQTGFSRAIVQRRDEPAPYLDTIWCVGAVRGLVLASLAFGVAPVLSWFFRTPDLTPVLRAVSIGMLLTGFLSPAWMLLERDLRLIRYSTPRTVAAAVDLCVTCTLAFMLRSVWAMVFGYLSGTVVLVCMTYVMGPFRPRLRFDRDRARQLYSFGKHVFRYEVTSYFVDQSDRLSIGRLRDATALGLYSFAARFATLPVVTVFNVMIRVVFPAFSRIQAEPERLKVAFGRLIGLMAAISFPVAAGMLATAPDLIPVVFGDKWTPMTLSFQILCVFGGFLTLSLTCGAVSGGIGKPELPARSSILRLLTLGVAIVPATLYYGIEGAAAAATAGGAISAIYLLVAVSRALNVPLGDHARLLGAPAVASALVIVAVAAVRWLLPAETQILLLAAQVLAGTIVYLVALLLIDRLTGSTLLESLRRALRPD